ncbi:MAG TPA: FxsA family protein [Acidimicrobiales bacterium]|nr:FxsA family protein [Acidimicrobiales bacterium]
MFAVLALLFLVVPFVELFVLIQVGQLIGAWYTIGILVLVSILGTYLVRREGLGVLQRAQAQLRSGQVPGVELVDGAMILFAGALLLTPGFLTDVFGILLLLPPVRSVLRAVALRWLTRRAGFYVERGGGQRRIDPW